jgi:hypothetical protein
LVLVRTRGLPGNAFGDGWGEQTDGRTDASGSGGRAANNNNQPTNNNNNKRHHNQHADVSEKKVYRQVTTAPGYGCGSESV